DINRRMSVKIKMKNGEQIMISAEGLIVLGLKIAQQRDDLMYKGIYKQIDAAFGVIRNILQPEVTAQVVEMSIMPCKHCDFTGFNPLLKQCLNFKGNMGKLMVLTRIFPQFGC